MSTVFYLSYEFIRAVVQKLSAALSASAATDTITTTTDHGAAVGDTLIFTNDGGSAEVDTTTRYYVVNVGSSTTLKISATKGGSPITLGTEAGMTLKVLHEIPISWPNQAQTEAENTDYTWEGGGDRKQISLLRDLRLNFSSAAIPASAHAEIFDKTAISSTDLPGGMTSVKAYGGGNDKGGVTVGLRLEGYAIKSTDGVESTVNFARWFPQGTLTYVTPATMQTGQAAGTTGYSFSASRVTTDLTGLAITGASTGGEFFFEGEIA